MDDLMKTTCGCDVESRYIPPSIDGTDGRTLVKIRTIGDLLPRFLYSLSASDPSGRLVVESVRVIAEEDGHLQRIVLNGIALVSAFSSGLPFYGSLIEVCFHELIVIEVSNPTIVSMPTPLFSATMYHGRRDT